MHYFTTTPVFPPFDRKPIKPLKFHQRNRVTLFQFKHSRAAVRSRRPLDLLEVVRDNVVVKNQVNRLPLSFFFFFLLLIVINVIDDPPGGPRTLNEVII